jgi:hypothetical protein
MLATYGSIQSHQTYTGDKLLKIELSTNTRAEVSFRGQRDVVKSEIRYITLLMIKDLKYSNAYVATTNLQSKVYTYGKGWRLGGQQVILLLNENQM